LKAGEIIGDCQLNTNGKREELLEQVKDDFAEEIAPIKGILMQVCPIFSHLLELINLFLFFRMEFEQSQIMYQLPLKKRIRIQSGMSFLLLGT